MAQRRIKGIKLVIFDLDGTLIDAYQAIIESFNYAMIKARYPHKSALAIRRAVGWGDLNLLKPFVREEDLSKVVRMYRRHHKTSLLRKARLFPGVKELLAYLKKKEYKLAIASNRPTFFSRLLIRHLKLSKYFEYVICADKLEHGKPHPEILNNILEKFQIKPSEAIYVGDMAIDAQAGKRAKINTLVVTTGSSTKSEINKAKPYMIIPRIKTLMKII